VTPQQKTVLLISPQLWGDVYVSKHHYAMELVEAGYQVYFLNPPGRSNFVKMNITRPKPGIDLHVIHSSFPNFLFLRYHAGNAYSIVARRWLKKILSVIPPIDIVWCFDTNTIPDLSVFKNSKKIFHVVDPINEKMIKVADTADVTICVSNRILDQFKDSNIRKRFVNHALSGKAIEKAGKIDPAKYNAGPVKRIGYVGNLSRSIIDSAAISRVVSGNPQMEFHFWGPGKEGNLGGENNGLVQQLASLSNAVFHPAIPSDELVEHIAIMDAFILAYKNVPGIFDSSNSHKILEYMATGKVIISTYIDQYRDMVTEGYLAMTPENANGSFDELFCTVMADLASWNTREKMEMRRSFAFSNDYRSNTEKILLLLGEGVAAQNI
jgi:glycosyltransferase involved in cell wall biosynthesis